MSGSGSRGRFAVEKAHGIAQGGSPEHPEAVDGPRLRVVGERHHQRRDAQSSAREADRESAAHRLDLTVERELADHGEGTDSPARHGAGGGENTEGDR